MTDYRLLIAQGKQIVFEHDKEFAELWGDILDRGLNSTANSPTATTGTWACGHQRSDVIGLFLNSP